MGKKIKKILKVVGISVFVVLSLSSGLPLLHEDISPKCIEQIPANIDSYHETPDCSKIEIQLGPFDSTASGAMISGLQIVGFE